MAQNQCESSEPVHKVPLERTSKILAKTNVSNLDSVKESTLITDSHCKVHVKVYPIAEVSNLFHPQLQNTIHIKPNHFLGAFLNSVQLVGTNNNPYSCKKTSRLPYSRFQFTQNRENGSTFKLSSNFSGSKYNLTINGENIFTISFTVSCSVASCRQFQLYGLCPGVAYNSLEGSDRKLDLEDLFTIGDNHSKMIRLKHLQPQMNPYNGELALEFVRRSVVPSVQNAVIVDKEGKLWAQMFKMDNKNDIFQVCFSKNIPMEWAFALVLASLDFKLALE